MENERGIVTNGEIDLAIMPDSDWERIIDMLIAEMPKVE